MHQVITEAVTLKENRSWMRTDFLKKLFTNSLDSVRYYYFLMRVSQLPVIGVPLKKVVNLYYNYIHTNSIKLPFRDMEKVIRSVQHLYVEPCPCRLIQDNPSCETALFTCIRINYAADICRDEKKEKNKLSRTISAEEAIEILKNGRKSGAVFSLESCIQPYQNNICVCCTCCCIEIKGRYEFGLDMSHSGPYIPKFTEAEDCSNCLACVGSCPVDALDVISNKPVVDLSRCLGCGICWEICPDHLIEMEFSRDRLRKVSEPGFFRMAGIMLFVYLQLFPLYFIYLCISGKQMKKEFNVLPRKLDIFS